MMAFTEPYTGLVEAEDRIEQEGWHEMKGARPYKSMAQGMVSYRRGRMVLVT